MRGFFYYWVMGCIIAGLVMSGGEKYAPEKTKQVKPLDWIEFIAIWPAYIVSTVFGDKEKLSSP